MIALINAIINVYELCTVGTIYMYVSWVPHRVHDEEHRVLLGEHGRLVGGAELVLESPDVSQPHQVHGVHSAQTSLGAIIAT